VSVIKLETKRTVKIVWMGAYNKEESTHLFLSSKTSLVYDLAQRLLERMRMTPMGTGRVRVFEVAGDERTPKDFTGSEMIGNIAGPDLVELFAEEIPREELELGVHDKVVNVFHFAGDIGRMHGVPFKFVVKPAERLSEMKKRLQCRLGVSGEDFSQFRFTLVQTAPPCRVYYLDDADVLYEHRFTVGVFFRFGPRIQANKCPRCCEGYQVRIGQGNPRTRRTFCGGDSERQLGAREPRRCHQRFPLY